MIIEENNGNLSMTDRRSLHHIIMAFFLQGSQKKSKIKMFELLKKAHDEIDSIERDTNDMNIYGMIGTTQSSEEE